MNIKMNIIDVQAIQGGLKIIARKTDSEYNGMLRLFLEIGAMMLVAGAEINRVEDTLSRMGEAYGAAEMNVFVITSSIVVTMVITMVIYNYSKLQKYLTFTIINILNASHIRSLCSLRAYQQIVNSKYICRLL